MTKKLFVIPIYLYDSDEEVQREKLGIDEDKPLTVNQTPYYTTYISSYWPDPRKNKHTGTKDIVFYVDGVEFRTPYSEQILAEVIRPAMVGMAQDDDEPNTNQITTLN